MSSKVIELAKKEIGYLEKASDLKLDGKKENAGLKNFTKYARDLYPSLQGQPWCDMFIDWLFVKCYGKIKAERMIGGFSAYTPTSANYYKKADRWYTFPMVGDQIFFKNDVRINHTGLVIKVTKDRVYTIEGNTSTEKDVVANGGGVCEKSYDLKNKKIAGYGRPKWDEITKALYEVGWHKDGEEWWYADTGESYYKNTWQVINGHKYFFDGNGYAVKGWQTIDSKKYFFEDVKNHELECALYVSSETGEQTIGKFKNE